MRKANKPKRIAAKPLVALDPGCPSLAKLPRDLLAIITDLLEATSPSTLISLGLVNSLLYCLAKTSRQRQLIFDLTADEQASITQRCTRIESEGLLSAVRKVTVVDKPAVAQKQSDSRQTCLTTICRLLPLMTGLKSVMYQSNCVPNEVLTVLKALPHLNLCTSVTAVGRLPTRPTTPEDNLVRLCGNANLHTLDVKVTYFKPIDCLEIMRPLKRLLTSCPNLRCLSLDIDQPSNVSSGYGPSQDYCGLGFEDGDKIPPLEQLVLTSYPFGHEPRNDGRILDFNSRGYPIKGTEIDYWADNFDWSHLRKLQTFNGDFAMKLMPKLTALEDFELSASWLNWDVPTFCPCVPTALRSISAPTLKSVTLDGVLRHSTSLQELRTHQAESHQPGWSEDAIDLASLQRIQEDCRLISDLSLDIARSGDWPYAMFDVLASFPNLRRLEVWFELGISDPENPVKPIVTSSAAEHIFNYIRSKYPRGGASSLKRLVLHAGPPPSGYGLPSPETCWPQHNSTTFTCQLSERDDEAAAGIFSINPPTISTVQSRLYDGKGARGQPEVMSSASLAKPRTIGTHVLAKLRKSFARRG